MLFFLVSACPSTLLVLISHIPWSLHPKVIPCSSKLGMRAAPAIIVFSLSHEKIAGKHSLVKHGPGSRGVAVANGGICKEFSIDLVPLRVGKINALVVSTFSS